TSDSGAAGDEHGHADGATSHTDPDEQGHADQDAAASGAAPADPVARWLSGGALAAALAALVVAVTRRRT
ncbi:MAG: hypothetical protein WBP48_18510, partial [Microbacterium sp.]